MFDPERALREKGRHTVLLDGERSSFALSVGNLSDLESTKHKQLSWCWSANLPFNLVVHPNSKNVVIQRWDAGGPVRSITVADEHGARLLFAKMSNAEKTAAQSGVQRMLRLFRSLRRAILPETPDAQIVVRVFNAFLLSADAVRRGLFSTKDFRKCDSIADIFGLLSRKKLLGKEQAPPEVGGPELRVREFTEVFLEPDPATGCTLDTNVLLRHASGELYQEAHLELERPAFVQSTLFGIPSGTPQVGKAQPDAKFTAPPLARLLAECALRAHRENSPSATPGTITVLDPACGAGVFLIEAWRELMAAGHVEKTQLIGYDNSPTACEMARFGLEQSVEQGKTQILVEQRDSLEKHVWAVADVILMNPPFASWNDMLGRERTLVEDRLGNLFYDHADKALAFVQTAVSQLKPGSALGCVVPAPLLESRAGLKWRSSIVERPDLALCVSGCFRGFRYFRGATVEPAFLVIVRRQEKDKSTVNVQVLLANDGFEDEAIRQVRRDPTGNDGDSREWSVFQAAQSDFSAASWLPRSRESTARLASLAAKRLPTVTELFRVNLGIRTGFNKAFVLRKHQLDQMDLNADQARWFRPVAGNATIRSGRLLDTHFVFYPYDAHGKCVFRDAGEIRAALRPYFDDFLLPYKTQLDEKRLSKRDRDWWELSEPRVTWQATLHPKIVTSYFGQRGSFAFDERGRFAVVQGFGWTWRGSCMPPALPWAYIAVLNSRVFQGLLGHFCPTVRGGQFDLSVRFVKHVPLPELATPAVTSHTINELAEHGRVISTGEFPPLDILDRAACRAYGLVYEEWLSREA
jgi:hypothetical protein